MMPIPPLTRRDAPALIAVLMIAALARLWLPGAVEFRHDEALLSLITLDMLRTGTPALTGMPSSVGVPNPPVSVYVLAIPYALGAGPLAATAFIAALNVAGAGLLWLLARRWAGPVAALAAGLIYAVNPWAALYSRKIWAQDFLTPFLLLALICGLLGFRDGRRAAQVAFFPLLIFALQIHFAAWALLPLALYLLWIGRARVDVRAVAAGLVLAALTLLPFAAGLADTLRADPERLSGAVGRGGGLALDLDGARYTALFAAGAGVELVLDPAGTADLPDASPRPDALFALVFGGLTVAGALRWRHLLTRLALLWVALPVLAFLPGWTAIYPHYFIASLPALALLAGLGFALVWQLGGRGPRAGIALALAATCAWALIGWLGVLAAVEATATPGGVGPPLGRILPARDAAAGPRAIILSDGNHILYDQEAAAWPVLLRDSCVSVLPGDGAALLPAEPFAVVTAPNAPMDPAGNFYAAPAQTFPLRPGEGAYTVARFDSAPAAPPLTPIQAAQFGSGAQLHGYSLDGGRLTLDWRLPGAVDADYHYFVHLLDADGERVAQHDAPLLPGRFWCAGDRLLTWAALDVPAAARTLRVGLYTLAGGHFVNDALLDPTGHPAALWLDIPLTSDDR